MFSSCRLSGLVRRSCLCSWNKRSRSSSTSDRCSRKDVKTKSADISLQPGPRSRRRSWPGFSSCPFITNAF
ncbi:hypothetical protein OJAV_G00194070 [Oryzias javanicus]|uniref:Uncharacterized protein n=1 Tax=Oryzias javanicus TaxID=123683 RepID=A0A3S2P892_ORYJA|nr:hypothetical protein OJAV_G00194070 [Oryzias javanicus]